MDLVMDEFLTTVADRVDGYAGGARLVCKAEWDYKIILKFEDLDSLKGYMGDHHKEIFEAFKPAIKELAVDGKIHEQNFVCAFCIPYPPLLAECSILVHQPKMSATQG